MNPRNRIRKIVGIRGIYSDAASIADHLAHTLSIAGVRPDLALVWWRRSGICLGKPTGRYRSALRIFTGYPVRPTLRSRYVAADAVRTAARNRISQKSRVVRFF
jgi:hypothetical protein